MDFFCDAAVLSAGGIPSVVFGPGDIAQAHTADEWISLASLERGKDLLLRFLKSLSVNSAGSSYCPTPMSAETTPNPRPIRWPKPRHHAAFFRQSGWLMIANVGSGVMMYAVHLLNKKIPPAEYGIFGVLLAVAMFVPNMPLQMVFAQQTAQALATDRKRELAGMIRLAWLGTFGLLPAAGARHVHLAEGHPGRLANHQSGRFVDHGVRGVVFLLAADVLGRAAGTAEFSLVRLDVHFQRRRAGWVSRRSSCWRWALTRAE